MVSSGDCAFSGSHPFSFFSPATSGGGTIGTQRWLTAPCGVNYDPSSVPVRAAGVRDDGVCEHIKTPSGMTVNRRGTIGGRLLIEQQNQNPLLVILPD